ncbi:MAG: ABC transporter permease [Armatimonadota bacterium]|nr:ABC transporter permease [Armatimonadota bacterium]MDW8155784.1 ABC transporter permease [Armatimonadota bacterium]
MATEVRRDVVVLEAQREPGPRAWSPLLRGASLAAVVAVWELASRLGGLPAVFLPPPTAVAAELAGMAASGELWRSLQASLFRIVTGFLVGTGAGVLVGTAVAVSPVAEAVADPLVAATYPIPKIALLPLLVLWLGIGEASKVAVIAIGAFFPVAVGTAAGIRGTDPLLVRAAVSLGASPLQVITKVRVPAALPVMFAGFRLAAGMSLLLVVSAEMIAAATGIGFTILHAGDLMQTSKLLAAIVVLSALGLLSSWGLQALERRVVRGRPH